MKKFIMEKSIALGLFASIIIINIYVWGSSYLDWLKEISQKPQEVYINLGDDYQIGKHNKVNKICNTNEEIGCLNGEILGYRKVNGETYLYLYIWRGNVTTTNSDGTTEVIEYSYSLFKNNERKFVSSQGLIPKYGYLSNNNKFNLYSEDDLKSLPKEQQKIFKELEEKPTIIINGINYTK